MKKTVAAGLMLGMMMPMIASAQTSTSSIQTLLDQIKALQTQMQSLQTQREQLAQQQQQLSQQQMQTMRELATTLRQGNSGENVRILQQLLAMDPSIYPEGTVSGFYGKRTEEAVKRFQKKHGIEQAGSVGPKTMKKLNEMMREYMKKNMMGGMMGSSTRPSWDDDDNKPCFAQGRTTAQGFLKNFGEDGRGKEFKGREWDDRPCVGTTTPPTPVDFIAPVISSASVSGIATTTATVAWTTNENATGKVYYGTANPLVLGTASSISTSTLTLAHSFALSGLTASTTYYYVLQSKDAANNTATSGQGSFTTTN